MRNKKANWPRHSIVYNDEEGITNGGKKKKSSLFTKANSTSENKYISCFGPEEDQLSGRNTIQQKRKKKTIFTRKKKSGVKTIRKDLDYSEEVNQNGQAVDTGRSASSDNIPEISTIIKPNEKSSRQLLKSEKKHQFKLYKYGNIKRTSDNAEKESINFNMELRKTPPQKKPPLMASSEPKITERNADDLSIEGQETIFEKIVKSSRRKTSPKKKLSPAKRGKNSKREDEEAMMKTSMLSNNIKESDNKDEVPLAKYRKISSKQKSASMIVTSQRKSDEKKSTKRRSTSLIPRKQKKSNEELEDTNGVTRKTPLKRKPTSVGSSLLKSPKTTKRITKLKGASNGLKGNGAVDIGSRRKKGSNVKMNGIKRNAVEGNDGRSEDKDPRNIQDKGEAPKEEARVEEEAIEIPESTDEPIDVISSEAVYIIEEFANDVQGFAREILIKQEDVESGDYNTQEWLQNLLMANNDDTNAAKDMNNFTEGANINREREDNLTDSKKRALHLNNDNNISSTNKCSPETVDDVVDVAQKSPSVISMDSAKGSSVNNDGMLEVVIAGDLFWSKVYSYCYWPCIVCPDANDDILKTEMATVGGSNQCLLIHVCFFTNNGRRTWVKSEALLQYAGLDHYKEKMLEAATKFGKISSEYQSFVVPQESEALWYQAIYQADILLLQSQEDRLEKFYEMYESLRSFQAEAMNAKRAIASLYSPSEHFLGEELATKRSRSSSPASPAYSPLASKRRKLHEGGQDALIARTSHGGAQQCLDFEMDAATSSIALSPQSTRAHIYDGNEFKAFFNVLRDFVMLNNSDAKLEQSLVIATRNIWALQHINKRQMEMRLAEHTVDDDARGHHQSSLNRFSNRLRKIALGQRLTDNKALLHFSRISNVKSLGEHASTNAERSVRAVNRPIEEVIEDIYNLDQKYLFRGLGRDPVCKYCLKADDALYKCSKTCKSWFHPQCAESSQQPLVTRMGRKRKALTKVGDMKWKWPTHHDDNIKSELLMAGKDADAEEEESTATATAVAAMTVATLHAEGVCRECTLDARPKCEVCKESCAGTEDMLVYCHVQHCSNGVHPTCCKYWPQAKITKSKNQFELLHCPSHVCHTCVSDDPKRKYQHISSSNLTKCIKCPATFHTDSTCIPAGSEILTAAFIICPRHNVPRADQKINVNWCFICVKGGQLVCCETCPTAVHAACLNIPINADEVYICDECEAGRLPLYGDVVWAKFNNFRWWPAIILPPTEVPHNIMRRPHKSSEFVVRFFGTHDHGWISRRRVYLYLEGDSMGPPKSKTSLDNNYNRGTEEAKHLWPLIKSKRSAKKLSNGPKQRFHPQPYVKIKTNRAVAPLKLHIDVNKINKCDCHIYSENPCGPDSNCLNRVLYHECNPKYCPAGERCQNQMFETRKSPKLKVVHVNERGFGLICREPISGGAFVIEYVGEVINDREFKQRLMQKSIDRDENFYFLFLEKDCIIDAGPKGNLARFMNHSCEPNCQMQKWSVNGLNRVGLFAITDIPTDTELTFNYHWDELLGSENKACLCGSSKCAGQIGGKPKEIKIKEEVKTVKVRSKPLKSSVKKEYKPAKEYKKPANTQTETMSNC